MPKAKTRIQFGYRFIDLSESLATSIRADNSDLKWWVHKNENGTQNIGFSLKRGANYSKLVYSYKRKKQIRDAKHGLFVSLTCYEDQSGFTMPEFVRKLYTDIGGEIDVSIIFAVD